ncbi:MAG: hypothetical protein ACRD22_16625 [Terriglobia bacterium]
MAAKKQATKKANKRPSRKVINSCVYRDGSTWTVQYGELKRGKGRPPKEQHLFKVAAEKLPYDSLPSVKTHLKKEGHTYQGIYVTFDSMGCPRYVGRGNIFARLEARKKAQPLELQYYSFYVVSQKQHEREVESLLIRAASFLLEFNERKRRVGLSAGAINDYEAGMFFYERQRKRGKRPNNSFKRTRKKPRAA